MDIKLSDIILVRGTGLIDESIEHITHSPYSHATGLVKPNELIEAQGFRKTGYQGLDFYRGQSDVFTFDALTDEARQRIVDRVMQKVGTGYDYVLIGWELSHFILHLDLPYKEGESRHDCSMLWVDAYRSEGYDPCPGIEYPTPGDLGNSALFRKVGSY